MKGRVMRRFVENLKLATSFAGLVLALATFVIQIRSQEMPGMKMPSRKTSPASGPNRSRSSTPKNKKTSARKRKPVKKHDMANMPGMNMPGMNMSGMRKHTRRRERPTRKRQPITKHQIDKMPGKMPGMKMPGEQASPRPNASPQQMNMPG